jgi:hypothetical protein
VSKEEDALARAWTERIQKGRDLEQTPTAKWTPGQAYAHLRLSFDLACKQHPDVMEPWASRYDGCANREEQTELMRRALRETLASRMR